MRILLLSVQSVRVSIWDTAGQERFHALGPLYYRDAGGCHVYGSRPLIVTSQLRVADGALLVYDITDEASFTRVKDWVKELRKMLGDDIVIALAGNKSDMEKSRFGSLSAD
jgi:Ras-related protein Rab-21